MVNITLGTDPNATLDYAPGLELHQLIMSKLGEHKGQSERELDILITNYWVYILKSISREKIRNNTVEATFGILCVHTEPEKDLRVKPIVEIDNDFLLEFIRYSSD